MDAIVSELEKIAKEIGTTRSALIDLKAQNRCDAINYFIAKLITPSLEIENAPFDAIYLVLYGGMSREDLMSERRDLKKKEEYLMKQGEYLMKKEEHLREEKAILMRKEEAESIRRRTTSGVATGFSLFRRIVPLL